jgi:nitric oxide synthase oxygenase domain/subunit
VRGTTEKRDLPEFGALLLSDSSHVVHERAVGRHRRAHQADARLSWDDLHVAASGDLTYAEALLASAVLHIDDVVAVGRDRGTIGGSARRQRLDLQVGDEPHAYFLGVNRTIDAPCSM